MKKSNWKVSLFELSGCLTVLCTHIIGPGGFRGKMGKKRLPVFENIGTNTGLNMQNEPAVGCRLGENDFHNLSMLHTSLFCTYKGGGVTYSLLRGAWILQRHQEPHSAVN